MGLEGPEFSRGEGAVTESLGVGDSVHECFLKAYCSVMVSFYI